jgi:16S rRNA (uracil1498-N3)-methyltransferase
VSAEVAAIAVRAAASAQAFVDTLADSADSADSARPVDVARLSLSPEDVHHFERVLRLRAGEEIIVGDGAGHWARVHWRGEDTRGASPLQALRDESGLGGDGSVQFEAPATPALTVAFAPTKGERPEWVVQKLTELGIDRIVPLVSERSVVRWSGARGQSAVARLRRVAREAAAQCRRVWLPEVAEVASFAELAGLGAPGQVVLAQLSGDRPSALQRVVAVGPEGGWSSDELASGLPTVGFGLSVLRAETAAVTAGALMASLRTGTVAPVAPMGESS